METVPLTIPPECLPEARPAYDADNLHPLDEEARKYDDNSEGIDWDEIIATTEDDYRAGRFAYSSRDYPDEAAARAGLHEWMDSILKRVLSRNEASRTSGSDAARR